MDTVRGVAGERAASVDAAGQNGRYLRPSERPTILEILRYTDSAFRGGPEFRYVERGFEVHAQWVDAQLEGVVKEKGLVDRETDAGDCARVACCLKWIR